MSPSVRSMPEQLPTASRRELNSPAHRPSSPIQTGVSRSGFKMGKLHIGRQQFVVQQPPYLKSRSPLRARIRSMLSRSTATPAKAPERDTTKYHQASVYEQAQEEMPIRERREHVSGVAIPSVRKDCRIDEGNELRNDPEVGNALVEATGFSAQFNTKDMVERRHMSTASAGGMCHKAKGSRMIEPVGRLAQFIHNKSQHNKKCSRLPENNSPQPFSSSTACLDWNVAQSAEASGVYTPGALGHTRPVKPGPDDFASFGHQFGDLANIHATFRYEVRVSPGGLHLPSGSQLEDQSHNLETYRPGDTDPSDLDSSSCSSYCSADTPSTCSEVRRAWTQDPEENRVFPIYLDPSTR